MYLQITTKCNMHCDHCGYSCNKNGKHMDYNTVIDAIAFCREMNDETIDIGGGEPTLHPRFFDIIKYCLTDFSFVWLATNGSRTKSMLRLADIIDGNDMEIYQENQLAVALSQDCFHNPINPKVSHIWNKKVYEYHSPYYQIKDNSEKLANQGRAKKNHLTNLKHCLCDILIVKPNGDIKMCGCEKSPIIGDIWKGIDEKWERLLSSAEFSRTNCYQSVKSKVEKLKRRD